MPDPKSPYFLKSAEIEWDDNDVPIAADFKDIYFQKLLGLEETEYVFLEQNELALRWSKNGTDQKVVQVKHFTIAETGFGTGLNFLATWKLWNEIAPKNWHLHFISTEKHPLKTEDLKRSLQLWPQLKCYSEQLIHEYPPLIPGYHSLDFDNDNVHLHLLFGDAIESFEQLRSSDHPDFGDASPHKVDAWFLDGFAPAKNPSLWNDSLYLLMAQLSKQGTTLSTFTAVSAVRRGLAKHGFSMEKIPGFKKRNMLRGVFHEQSGSEIEVFEPTSKPARKHYNKGVKAPWYIPSSEKSKRLQSNHVAIIGGGLAGTTSAYALAKRGWKVTIVEREDTLASGASGNSQGMLYTSFSPLPGIVNTFTLTSYLYALRFYKQLLRLNIIDSSYIDFCGMLQLAASSKQKKMYESLREAFQDHADLIQFFDAAQASAAAGIKIEHPAWFSPGSGWVSPVNLCHALANHPNITVIKNKHVLSLEYDNTWQLTSQENRATDSEPITTADTVIIANGFDANLFSQSQALPIKAIRGQITSIPSRGEIGKLKTVICHEGYITPAADGSHQLGATFDLGDSDLSIRSNDHRRNLDSLYKAIPSVFDKNNTVDGGRVGLRCTTPDYLPITGQLHDRQAFINDYAALGKNSNEKIDSAGQYYPGLYINIAHGSRGLTSTPLCSELLAAQITGHCPPVTRNLVKALNPARFTIRDLIRNKQ
jgi:tRNA 5-methylaminomethyl-2-thiouridine biosynthesis bifunctional protein